jgi:hypothetical protein
MNWVRTKQISANQRTNKDIYIRPTQQRLQTTSIVFDISIVAFMPGMLVT